MHAEPIQEAYEDEDEATDTRAAHEVDDLRDSLVYEREDGDDDDCVDHEIARGIQQEPEALEEDEDEPLTEHSPSPVAPRPIPTAAATHENADEDNALSPPPPPRRNFPPPPPRVAVPPPPPPVQEATEASAPSPEEDEDEIYARHARDVGPEHEEEYRNDLHDEESEQSAHYSGEQELYPDEDAAEHEDQQSHDEYVPPPPPPRHAAVPPPPPPAVAVEEEEEEEEPVAPAPPPRRSSVVPPPPPNHAPPPVEDDEAPEYAEPADDVVAEEPAPPPPPRQTRPTPQLSTSPPISAKAISQREDADEQELLDESDGGKHPLFLPLSSALVVTGRARGFANTFHTVQIQSIQVSTALKGLRARCLCLHHLL